jgi:site-specific recombinase XerD
MIKKNFYLKSDKQNKDLSYPIYLKIGYKGKSVTLSTGKSITKERWNATNKLRNPLKIDTEKNCKLLLDRISEKIEKIYLELSKNNDNITAIDIKDKYTGKSDKLEYIDIIYLFTLHNKYFEKKVLNDERGKASLQKYGRAKDLVLNFINNKYGQNSFPCEKINNQFIYDLEAFLKYESVYLGKKGIANNSVVKYFKSFKTMCNYGIKMELITKNPFQNYDGKLVIKDATYLTLDELQTLEQKEFKIERLERVRDIFLFSAYTSYAPIDVANLTTENLVRDNNDSFWIQTNRSKTTTRSNVPVLPPVMRIINKYANSNGSKLLPTISNQKMNAYLKEIADVCGISKKLTHYVARHTFATTVTLGHGVAIENVSSMMGHTRLTTTAHYAKVLDENVKKDMDKLHDKFS